MKPKRKEPVYQGSNGRWYWRRLSRNGQTIATGHQSYSRKWSAKRAYLRQYPRRER